MLCKRQELDNSNFHIFHMNYGYFLVALDTRASKESRKLFHGHKREAVNNVRVVALKLLASD